MLEKNAEKMYFDAHFHYFFSKNYGIPDFFYGCSCAHSKKEWEFQLENAPSSISFSYGIHPQSCGHVNIIESSDFLEQLLQERQLEHSILKERFVAIGEAGFDYFTDDFKQFSKEQEDAFNIQIELSQKYQMPLVIHCRKANHKLFEYSKQLNKVPSVLFHSFMGPSAEALSLLNHGINGFFSFGKQMMNNNKKVIDCVKALPVKNLLLETDAPYQFLKGESYTAPEQIKNIYNAAIALRKENTTESVFMNQMKENYYAMFASQG